MKVTIWGGAGEHGRACFLVEDEGRRILMDFGAKKNGENRFPCWNRMILPKLNGVFLSHVHEDHCAALPLLLENGYTGKIWTTQFNAAYLIKLYRLSPDCFEFLENYPSLTWNEIFSGLRLCWGRSGHAPGAVWFLVEINGKRLFYSGDYTSYSPLLKNDGLPFTDLFSPDKLDLAVLDTAHGVKTYNWYKSCRQLFDLIKKVVERGGQLLLPVPPLGRGQDFLMMLQKQFPETSIGVEEKIFAGLQSCRGDATLLSAKGTRRITRILNGNLTIISTAYQREAGLRNCRIFLVTDSMLEVMTARYYFQKLARDPRNALIFTGHLEEGTFGHRIITETPGDAVMSVYRSPYKIHQGIEDIKIFLKKNDPCHTLLVHLERTQTERVAKALTEEGYRGIHAPYPGESFVS